MKIYLLFLLIRGIDPKYFMSLNQSFLITDKKLKQTITDAYILKKQRHQLDKKGTDNLLPNFHLFLKAFCNLDIASK